MNTATQFPLITLQPAVDSRNAWAALLLEGNVPLDSQALSGILFDHGLTETLETLPCVAPVEPSAIDPELAGRLPAGRFILRIPIATASDPAAHDRLAALQQAGFGLMAGGFPHAGADLFPGITSLAVACPGHSMPAGFGDWLRRLPGPHLALGTAEHVCPGFCKFHWLAGHLAGLASYRAGGDPTTRSLLLQLLALVMADAATDEIDALIRRDANLSYHLLKLVNSVAFMPGRKVESFAQAIALLGRRQLQRWLQLLLYVRPHQSEAASPLLPRAAMRACLMEALARRCGLGRDAQDQAFMIGMFSLLDILFGMSLAEIIAPLNLPEDAVQALVAGNGQLGQLLAAVVAGEGADFPALAGALAVPDIGNETWAAALVEAAGWAAQISREA